ncbi:uncharacterized protein [Mytilus edulis]|uniref:uncharacterized protein n=1 Tax=Mytilus edulis TaxID=6550 RepID=UPI0039EF0FA6
MTHYSGIDESCDASALLSMVINIRTFPPTVQTDAKKIRSDIRNPWAHCDLTEWTTSKYTDSFQLMEQLVKDLGLSNKEENIILGELNTWETNGQHFLSGTILGLDIVEEIREETHNISKYVQNVLTETDNQFFKVQKELKDLENGLPEKIRYLENESKQHRIELDPVHGSIPAAILRMDKESIRIYMKALESGSEIKHDIRVIIVGKKGAGKTSLVRNLLKENLNNVKSTNGIDIHVKRCKIRTADGKWFFQEDSFISDISQRMLRSMITQTRVNESHRNKETANQHEDTIDLNIVHPHLSVEEANVQSRDTDDLTQLAAGKSKQESSDVTDKMQHDIDLREMIDSARDMDDKEYASLSFWDFAGDREFYNTHQTFLSKEAIYLVVTKLNEADDETNETLKFWFDSIHFYGTSDKEKHEDIEQVNRPAPSSSTEIENTYIDNASTQIYNRHDIADSKGKPTFPTYLEPPIIAIGTHKDQCLGNFKDQLRDQIIYNLGDSAARQHLRNCHYVSNITDGEDNFEVLRRDIFEIGKKMPDFGKQLPTRFIKLEKSLNEKLQAGTQFLSFVDVKALAEKKAAITNIAELDVFLRYHHNFGNLIYFKDIPEYIILNPQWLVNVFRLLVTADEFRDKLIGLKEWDEYETTGKLTESLLSCIFANQTEDITTCKEHILKIMEKFDIIVRPRMLVDDKEQVDPHYYVPCMIKTIASKQIQEQLKTPQEKSYCLCLEFNFLPPVFINHFIIACIRKFTTSKFRDHNRSPRLALFRCAGLFNINANGCEKLLVASFNKFIQFQIWKFDSGCRTSYKHIGKFILEEVDKIIHKNYRLLCINYEVKMKCESTSYDCFDGIISPDDNDHDYFCEEHDEMHVYRDDWFSEHKVTKKTAESQTEEEKTIDQKKDGDRFCFEFKFPQSMNKGCFSKETTNMTKIVKIVAEILGDALYDRLNLDTAKYQMYSRSQWDITSLYEEHKILNLHTPRKYENYRGYWGGQWSDLCEWHLGIGDDIERIRLVRNELSHPDVFALDDSRYEELCTIIEPVLGRFDNDNKPTHSYIDRYNEILKLTFENEDVRCIVIDVKSKL